NLLWGSPMDLATAVQIVRTLADGRNPLTGQPLAAEDVCQQAPVVRALGLIVQHMQQEETRNAEARSNLRNAGRPWSFSEEAELLQQFEAGATVKQLALAHGRTEQAIHGRLYRLGKLPPWPLVAWRNSSNDAAR